MLAGGGLVNYDDEAQEQEPLPKTPEMLNRPQFFAPALGIYISPLRDREQAQTEDEQAQEIDDRSDHVQAFSAIIPDITNFGAAGCRIARKPECNERPPAPESDGGSGGCVVFPGIQ